MLFQRRGKALQMCDAEVLFMCMAWAGRALNSCMEKRRLARDTTGAPRSCCCMRSTAARYTSSSSARSRILMFTFDIPLGTWTMLGQMSSAKIEVETCQAGRERTPEQAALRLHAAGAHKGFQLGKVESQGHQVGHALPVQAHASGMHGEPCVGPLTAAFAALHTCPRG